MIPFPTTQLHNHLPLKPSGEPSPSPLSLNVPSVSHGASYLHYPRPSPPLGAQVCPATYSLTPFTTALTWATDQPPAAVPGFWHPHPCLCWFSFSWSPGTTGTVLTLPARAVPQLPSWEPVSRLMSQAEVSILSYYCFLKLALQA